MRVAKPVGDHSKRVYEEVGKRIRATRLQRGVTQDDLAARVSMSRTSITNIEAGRQHFLLHTLYEIAAALRVGPAALLVELSQPSTEKRDVEQELPADLTRAEQEWIVAVATEPEDTAVQSSQREK